MRRSRDPLLVGATASDFSIHCDQVDGSILLMPARWAALRHAVPTVLEGLVAPIALFYLFLVLVGLRGALIAAGSVVVSGSCSATPPERARHRCFSFSTPCSSRPEPRLPLRPVALLCISPSQCSARFSLPYFCSAQPLFDVPLHSVSL